MAAERGSAFLLKLGGGSPVNYATVAGLKTTQMTINGDAVTRPSQLANCRPVRVKRSSWPSLPWDPRRFPALPSQPLGFERLNMDETARFALPQLVPGQAQKEVWHNEALQRIDLLLSPTVETMTLSAPPSSPARGACYVVASGATGAWAGKDDMLAGYADGGWRFVAPVEGLRLLDRGSGQILLRRDGAWESGIVRAEEVQIGGLTVVRQRQPAIANPTGGTVIDAECRTAIGSILTMLRTHGLIAS